MKAMRKYNARLVISIDKHSVTNGITVSDRSEAIEAIKRVFELAEFFEADYVSGSLAGEKFCYAIGFDTIEFIEKMVTWRWMKIEEQLDMLIDN